MADPLKQFKIEPVGFLPQFELGGVDLSYTNSSLWMTIGVLVSTLFLTAAMQKKALVPGRMQVFAEMLYEFVANMVRENAGPKARVFFPFVFTLFVIVLMGNVLGLIPFSFTYTSHIAVTGALAILVFFTVIIYGLYKNGLHFLQIFAPPGMPLFIYVILIPIELVSFLARPLTLSVRLFANMLAGHLILKVMAGFSAALIGLGVGGFVLSLAPLVFNAAIIAFELLIALVHAYVFALLSSIYLKDAVDLHH